MDYLESSVAVFSHLTCIAIFYHLLVNLFDWSKLIKVTPENISRLKLCLLFISIAVGYLVSSFILSVLTLSQELFFAFK